MFNAEKRPSRRPSRRPDDEVRVHAATDSASCRCETPRLEESSYNRSVWHVRLSDSHACAWTCPHGNAHIGPGRAGEGSQQRGRPPRGPVSGAPGGTLHRHNDADGFCPAPGRLTRPPTRRGHRGRLSSRRRSMVARRAAQLAVALASEVGARQAASTRGRAGGG